MMRTWLVFALALVAGCGWFKDEGGETGLGGVGDACDSTNDCRTTLVCSADGRCGPSGTGVVGSLCQLTGDCGVGLYCSAMRTCAMGGPGTDGASCATTADCAAGLVCVIEGLAARCRPAGAADIGDPCMNEVDCLAGLACLIGDGGSYQCVTPGPRMGTVPPTLRPWPGVECAMEEAGMPIAHFRVPRGDGMDGDFFRLPFPNDIRRTADGTLDLSAHPSPGTVLPLDIIDRYLRAIEEDLDGFSTNPVVLFRFSEPYVWESFATGLHFVDITPGATTLGEEQVIAWLTTAGDITNYVCPNWAGVRVQHGFPLRPGHTYAAIVSRGVNAEMGGAPFQPAADFTAVMGDARPSDPALLTAWMRYQPLRDWLSGAGSPELDAGDILTAAVFTTQSEMDVVPALREVIRARLAPEVTDLVACDTGVESPCDDGTPERACGAADPGFTEIHGRIALPIFQAGTPPYLEPEDGGGIDRGADGRPTFVRSEPVCFALTVPNTPPPADGYPLVIGLGGTGSSFRTLAGGGLGGEMAAQGAATIAIELPVHGARRGSSTLDPEALVYNYQNPRAARDNFLQGAADVLTLVAWAERFSLAAGESPSGDAIAFDDTRLAFFGHSQGATHGALAMSHEPALRAIVLSGGGGDLVLSLLNKTEPVDIASVLPFALADAASDGTLAGGTFHAALALFQTYFDRVDPVNFGRDIRREPIGMGQHLFATFGLGDTYTPNACGQAWAVSAGFTLVNPVLTTDAFGLQTADPPLSGNETIEGAMWTIGMRQYQPDAGDDGHFVATQTVQGRADVVRFLEQALAGMTPPIGE